MNSNNPATMIRFQVDLNMNDGGYKNPGKLFVARLYVGEALVWERLVRSAAEGNRHLVVALRKGIVPETQAAG